MIEVKPGDPAPPSAKSPNSWRSTIDTPRAPTIRIRPANPGHEGPGKQKYVDDDKREPYGKNHRRLITGHVPGDVVAKKEQTECNDRDDPGRPKPGAFISV